MFALIATITLFVVGYGAFFFGRSIGMEEGKIMEAHYRIELKRLDQKFEELDDTIDRAQAARKEANMLSSMCKTVLEERKMAPFN